MTEIVSDELKELVELHERDFQKYSVANKVYCVPVDAVRCWRSVREKSSPRDSPHLKQCEASTALCIVWYKA